MRNDGVPARSMASEMARPSLFHQASSMSSTSRCGISLSLLCRKLRGERSSLRSVISPHVAFTRGASSRNGSRRLTSVRQQSQPLLVIHGLPRYKFLGKHIHSAKESQLDEKLHKIQVSKDQGAGLSHLVANTLEMDWHLGPVKAGTVVMAEVVPFVHEVHLIHNGHGISEIILRTFWVTESVLDPCGDGVDEIHAEKRNQHEHRPNSPIANKDGSEVSVVARHSPEHASSVLFIAPRFKVGVGSKPQDRPNVVREIPQEIEPASSIIADRVASVVGSAVLSMVETHMSGPAQFRNVAIKVP